MTSEEKEKLISEIIWPEKPVWLVETLCRIGAVKKWLIDDAVYAHMPSHYNIGGVEIQFLPHWTQYMVGGLHLDIPTDEEQIFTAVRHVNGLRNLGLSR